VRRDNDLRVVSILKMQKLSIEAASTANACIHAYCIISRFLRVYLWYDGDVLVSLADGGRCRRGQS
jgi:hypothetical protein